MSAANEEVKILTVASRSNVRAEHRSHVVVSGSYGGRYNAFNAAKWPVRAGIGKDKQPPSSVPLWQPECNPCRTGCFANLGQDQHHDERSVVAADGLYGLLHIGRGGH